MFGIPLQSASYPGVREHIARQHSPFDPFDNLLHRTVPDRRGGQREGVAVETDYFARSRNNFPIPLSWRPPADIPWKR